MKNKKTIRILIADKSKNVRRGLRALIKSFQDIQGSFLEIDIVGEAADGHEAVSLARTLVPDLIFMDIEMPLLNGIEATKTIKNFSENIQIILLSMQSSLEYLAIAAGAEAFIKKGEDTQIIKQVIWSFLEPAT